MLRWRAATREIAEPRRLVGINSSAALRAFFVPGECAELSARERPCLSAGVWRGGTQSSICVCVGCGCVAAFPVPARRRAQCCAWALLGGCIVVESGWGGAFFLAAARFVRVFARSSCTELIRTGEPRRTFSRWTEIISVRRAPARAPMPSHTTQPYMQRASSVRRERPRAIKHTNCSLETTPQQRHDPQIAFYTLNFGARCANVKRYELWRYEILHE